VHNGNPERGLPTIHAQVVLADARTGQPLSFMNGGRITNARTGCIGGLAARDLANQPATLGVLGAGAQARWQIRAVAALTDLDSVRVYSPSDSREKCAADLRTDGINVSAVDSPEAAVVDASIVVTATTSAEPVFPTDALSSGTLVIAVGAYSETTQELESATFDRAARVFADIPEEVVETGDILATDLSTNDLVPLSAVLEDETGRESTDEILVVESVGTAALDVATAAEIYESAEKAGFGTEHPL
jgi:alanine dehydrogenase